MSATRAPARSLTPQQEVLLLAVRADRADEGRLRELLRQELDWEALREVTIQAGLFPLAYQRLTALGDGCLPAPQRAEWRRLYLASAQRNLRLVRRLLEVLRHLAEHGIEAVPLKGPTLAAQVYGDVLLRQSADLDILVRPKDAMAVFALLPELGYNRLPLGEREAQRMLRTAMEQELGAPDGVLDVHWALNEAMWSFPISLEGFWEGLETVTLNGTPVRCLSRESTLLALCISGARDQWREVKPIADLAHLLNGRELAWEGIWQRARGLGITRMVRLGLYLAREVGGATLPLEVMQKLEADRRTVRFAGQLQERLFATENDARGMFDAFLHSTERLRDYLYYVVTPKPPDRAALPLPEALEGLYYLVRPVRLTFTYLGMGARALTGQARRERTRRTAEQRDG